MLYRHHLPALLAESLSPKALWSSLQFRRHLRLFLIKIAHNVSKVFRIRMWTWKNMMGVIGKKDVEKFVLRYVRPFIWLICKSLAEPTCVCIWFLLRNDRQATGEEVHNDCENFWLQNAPFSFFLLGHCDEITAKKYSTNALNAKQQLGYTKSDAFYKVMINQFENIFDI